MRHSIIRRSSGVTIAFLAGHAFNYALFWGANRILDSSRFGLFYTAVLIIGVTMSPMMAVMLVLARRFAEIGVKAGPQTVAAMAWRVLGLCIRAAPFAVAAGVVLAAAAPWVGVQAWQVALLIPITVLTLVAVETVRTALQSLLLFARASTLWIVSNGTECLLSLAALYLFARVWTGIAGLLLGAMLAVVACLPWFSRAARREAADSGAAMALHLRREMPMIASYSLFVLFNNIDILLAYCLLPHEGLGIYAASAVLPKAIVTATFAIAQVVLPVVTEQRAGGLSFRLSAAKAVATAGAAAAVAAGLLWLAMPSIQRTPLAIRGLDFELMGNLAVAAVALSIVRVLVVIEVALQRYAVGLAQIGALVLFAVLCVSSHTDATRFAALYAITSSGFLLLSGGIIAASWVALPAWSSSRIDQSR